MNHAQNTIRVFKDLIIQQEGFRQLLKHIESVFRVFHKLTTY